jgi:putative ATP-dependent endonuclease of the OLD family
VELRVLRVFAENFRTLVNFDYQFQTGYCPISGANNAGKSCVIKILEHFLEGNERGLRYGGANQISFEKDHTQWLSPEHMLIGVCVEFDRQDDSETFFFLDKFAPTPAVGSSVTLKVIQKFEPSKNPVSSSFIDSVELDAKTTSEVIKKLRTSANLVIHNSTNAGWRRYYFDESLVELDEIQLDEKDKVALKDAERKLHTRISQAAKKQTEHLSLLLRKLNDEYNINLTTLDVSRRSAFPLSVILQDKQVQVPLHEWGSGTRNRTEILMSLMQAARTKAAASEEDRTTPIVILEEPESFLHPHAQAEFGKILSSLADELGIQVIATTHSPYMLNQRMPGSNVLLRRKSDKKRALDTEIVNTSGDSWMVPFSEILGIVPPEFESWKSVIGLQSDCAILVEGVIDQEYFHFFRERYPKLYGIPANVEIEAYGGVDALRNVAMLRFVRRKFKKMYITFDLDAKAAVLRSLESIGLVEKLDFVPVGRAASGAECIEGLLPNSVMQSVYGREIALVQQLNSAKPDERKSAKNSLKAKLLEELKSSNPQESELEEFRKLFATISKNLK